MVANAQEFEFQAETRRLLDIVINSLYTNKEIFLRELISNASDAIDRLRFEALTRPELIADDKFEIRLDADPKARTLTISDNGIGMTRDEVMQNVGTIAKSGTRELREKLAAEKSKHLVAEMIGQFGVGFYSSFMVADKVELVTRRAGEAGATRWESSGDGVYSIADAERPANGTSITLHLKPADPESGMEDFTDEWILRRIVKRHSDFVGYPIILEPQPADEAKPDQAKDAVIDISEPSAAEPKVLNSMKPIWTRPQTEVAESEYAEFYRHISHDWTEPFKTMSLRAEGRLEYQALLFIPSKAPYDLFYHGVEFGLRLYAKRVMIMEHCEDLLPRYLRFIKGVVDSADLPLNISRQMLQQDRHISQIRKWLTKKVLDTLEEMYEKEQDRYLEFWQQFGRSLKEGVSFDFENKDRLIPLLLFESSNDPQKLTSLKDYAGRMKEGQQNIFYLTGESRVVVENSPHLEAFKQKGYEVLYLVEPVDELVVQHLTEFEGKKLKSVGKGRVKLDDQDEKDLKDKEEQYTGLLQLFQTKLDEHVKQVRLTNRLTNSPACLVVEEHDYSPQLERILSVGKGSPKQRRVMELNPDHEIVGKLYRRFEADKEDPILADYAEVLFGSALLAEGSDIPDPARYNKLVSELMLRAL